MTNHLRLVTKCTTKEYSLKIRNDDDNDDEDNNNNNNNNNVYFPKDESSNFPQNVRIYKQLYCHIPNILNVVQICYKNN